MAELAKSLKNLSEKDRKMIAEAEAMLGPDPSEMGVIKNLFFGRLREDLLFPYPKTDPEETARCDQLLAALDEYLENEHPAVEIDQNQEIPRWVIDRLFDLGVMGMTIPREFGGLGLGITSYNRVLERIGHSCGSTAVLVSAHQSIGCKAVMLFGSEEQKKRWLPHLAKDWVSAFCLSEPNVGCDAGGQETRCELSPDGSHYILNGEKKWATSGALSSLFTVMAKQKLKDPRSGKETEKVTALVCTPDMEGVDIYQKNRSKCGIRGTWQARIRFKDVKVPRENLLHQEGKGLNVALTCLNYGRCTLSAGMLGARARPWTSPSSGPARATSSSAPSPTSNSSASASPTWPRSATPWTPSSTTPPASLTATTTTSCSRPRSARSSAPRWAGAPSTTPSRSWAASPT